MSRNSIRQIATCGCAAVVALSAPSMRAAANEPDWFKTELKRNVEFILDSATSYYVEEHVSRSGEVQPRAFPASTGRSPAEPACSGGKPKAAPVSVSTFSQPGWQSLNFSPDGPLWAQYSLESTGVGADASIIVRVHFDADCDGRESELAFPAHVENGVVVRDKPVVKMEPGFGRQEPEAEAMMNLRKIADSSTSYFGEEHFSRSGGAMPAAFPETTPRTPPQRPHCEDGKPVLMQPGLTVFSTSTWMALNFSVDDPFYYQYEYISSGTGKAAKFTARAIGDLDCDGNEAVYEFIGTVGNDNVVRIERKAPKSGIR